MKSVETLPWIPFGTLGQIHGQQNPDSVVEKFIWRLKVMGPTGTSRCYQMNQRTKQLRQLMQQLGKARGQALHLSTLLSPW